MPAETTKKRHYKERIYQTAFGEYLAGKGDNAEQLAKHLATLGISVSARTILRWMGEEDEAGETWESRRIALYEPIRREKEESAILEYAEIRSACSEILNGIFEDLKSGALRFKSKAEAVYSASNMVQLLQKLEQHDDRLKNPFFVIELYSSILSQIPTLRKALAQNQKRIRQLVEQALLNEREVNPEEESSG